MQILWINIIMDGPPAQSLGVEPVDRMVKQRPPRRKEEPIITSFLLSRVFTSAVLIVLGTLSVFAHEMEDGSVTRRDTTMTFTTFVVFDMMNALTCRSMDTPVYNLTQGFFSNKMFLYAVGGSLIGQLLVIYWPPMQSVFQTEALTSADLLNIVGLASTMLVLDSVRKAITQRRTGKMAVGGFNSVRFTSRKNLDSMV